MRKLIEKLAQIVVQKLIEQLGADGFRIQLLNVQPGDLILVKCEEDLTDKELQKAQAQWESVFPHNRLVVTHGYDIAVVHALKKLEKST
jgi:hypothetical protein